MRLIPKDGPVEIWSIDCEYFVYDITVDARVAHSGGAARAIVAGAGQ